MKISEAIRNGSKNSRHVSQDYFWREGGQIGACALGAAFLAVASPMNRERALKLTENPETVENPGTRKMQAFDLADTVLDEAWGWELEDFPITVKTKEGPFETFNLKQAIIYLNDDLDWTRERIADFLERQGL